MLLLVLQLTLGQALPPAQPQADPMQPWIPAPATPNAPPSEPNPEAPPSTEPYVEPEPNAPGAPHARPEISRWTRSLASTGGGILGGAAALGVAEVMHLTNNRLDYAFTNVGLGSIMIAGVAFTVSHAMGNHGEVIFALFGSIVMMAGAMLAATAIDPSGLDVAWLTTLIGCVPASVAAVGLLELSSPDQPGLRVAMGPGSVVVHF